MKKQNSRLLVTVSLGASLAAGLLGGILLYSRKKRNMPAAVEAAAPAEEEAAGVKEETFDE